MMSELQEVKSIAIKVHVAGDEDAIGDELVTVTFTDVL